MDPTALVHAEAGGYQTRCTKCDAVRAPLLRLEGDFHVYCENCFVVAGEMLFARVDGSGTEVWERRRIA
jgi:hypothetical protein